MTSHNHGQHHDGGHAPVHSHGHGHAAEDMLSVEEAYQRIMASFQALEAEEKPLLESMGQVLAEDITSPLALPPLANSAMDGYALRHSDIAGASQEKPSNLDVIGIVAAGQMPDKTVAPGTAIRIMTGAPMPDGADTVVPFEETDEVQRKREGKPLDQVAIFADMPVGCNVRPAGEDISQGALVLEKGTVVRAAEVGVIASLGMNKVKVIRRPVVAVLATGDELEDTGAPLSAGKIYDSNSFSVAASVVASGGVPRILGIARDNLEDLNAKLEATAGADLVVTSAGVSKGDYDIVKDVLNERGEMNFWSVRMRPAKPLAFGHLNGPGGGKNIPLLGLPGNPVSAMVAFEMFARPAIRTMLGRAKIPRPMVEGVLTGPIRNEDGRRVYARVEVELKDGIYQATPTGPQGSNILTSMSRANGLAICPEDLPGKNAGDKVQIIMLDWNEEVQV
ncbi:MAG: molybdopterin molybdotransferase MoeA [Chloroflexi bacterium]|nr:molybdopterin molybdotransferase MoeA [Chloroflexota bacterium]MCI0810403.1 molybdopterin molybdotransferase MoeA [Chloroflexota bacterium]MCI0828667.1 molybdopterin molybdotransferase MoeA [Chloroflexota bacterium]MCI0862966.1 molybdopterin molybdotransferase MoeA [Chloroflexota bacterium]MCI0899915.1 molybdopterin molybdotransferase MoeA [Chloroflexota bacterium]